MSMCAELHSTTDSSKVFLRLLLQSVSYPKNDCHEDQQSSDRALLKRFTSLFFLTELLLSLWSRTALHLRSPSEYSSTARRATALPANGETFVSYEAREQRNKCREAGEHNSIRQKHCWYRHEMFHSIYFCMVHDVDFTSMSLHLTFKCSRQDACMASVILIIHLSLTWIYYPNFSIMCHIVYMICG